ncbi:uncharacterized protein LOC143070913 [Mytilus galloprovincialis]|uniref:uncharacterized protein LOC143070913 n=1 Tax=Mytilus galloprovincialis TaxID=29158 RepID=UPI003F7BDB6E
MGPKRQGRKRQAPYDPELLENWTVNRLRSELISKNITFPTNARRMALVRLLRPSTSSVDDVSDGGHDSMLAVHQESSARSQNATPNVNNNNNDRTAILVDLVSKLSSNVQSLQQNVISLNNKVTVLSNNLPQNNNISTSQLVPSSSPVVTASVDGSQPIQNTSTSVPITSPSSTGNYSIESAMQSFQTSSFNRHVPSAAAGSEAQAREIDTRGYKRTCYGYSAESLPLVETISPQLRQNITAGRDVNLASLLIPFYAGLCSDNIEQFPYPNKPDPRLNRSLSIGEFVQAFSIYKNVMCSAYSQRRNELDLYERDIVDMATRYGGRGFYEYHRQFSLQAAAHLNYNNVMVDWSVRNNALFYYNMN